MVRTANATPSATIARKTATRSPRASSRVSRITPTICAEIATIADRDPARAAREDDDRIAHRIARHGQGPRLRPLVERLGREHDGARAVDVEDAVGGARLEGVEERRGGERERLAAEAQAPRGVGIREAFRDRHPAAAERREARSAHRETDAHGRHEGDDRHRHLLGRHRAHDEEPGPDRRRGEHRERDARAEACGAHALVLPRREAPAPVRVEIRRVEPERLLEPFAERGRRHAREAYTASAASRSSTSRWITAA